jgi:hypothetical protein
MGSNEILGEQLRLATSILRPERLGFDPDDDERLIDEAERLSELVIAMDQRLRKGGVLPRQWKKGRESRRSANGGNSTSP